jgi:hypothetical protein
MPKQRTQKKETAAQTWTKFSDALKKVCAHVKKGIYLDFYHPIPFNNYVKIQASFKKRS